MVGAFTLVTSKIMQNYIFVSRDVQILLSTNTSKGIVSVLDTYRDTDVYMTLARHVLDSTVLSGWGVSKNHLLYLSPIKSSYGCVSSLSPFITYTNKRKFLLLKHAISYVRPKHSTNM